MMITLVGGGAFLDFRNKRGQTPLHMAAFNENKEAVRVRFYLFKILLSNSMSFNITRII